MPPWAMPRCTAVRRLHWPLHSRLLAQWRVDRTRSREFRGVRRRAAEAPNVEVTKLASNEVGTSCPTSARKLAEPIPLTPGVSHGRRPTLSSGGTVALSDRPTEAGPAAGLDAGSRPLGCLVCHGSPRSL